MEPEEIKKIRQSLIVRLVVGTVILIVAVLFHRLGSKRPGPQTFWFFTGVLGATIVFLHGVKMIQFKKYLKRKNEES